MNYWRLISLVPIAGLLTLLLYTKTAPSASRVNTEGRSWQTPNPRTADYELWGP